MYLDATGHGWGVSTLDLVAFYQPYFLSKLLRSKLRHSRCSGLNKLELDEGGDIPANTSSLLERYSEETRGKNKIRNLH